MSKIDQIDKRIIELLLEDAHQSAEKLAKQLFIGAATARRRLKRLLARGALRIIAIPNPRDFGLPIVVVIALKVDREKMNEVLKTLSQRPRCYWVTTTTGRFDILTIEWFDSTDALSDFMQNEIAGIPGIRDTETFISLAVQKGFMQRT